MTEMQVGEELRQVECRARVHAALADPLRLRIVDELSLGDASPSELRALLGIPSNLLAHHLRALERVGLLDRRRSQADRRRSYLRLRTKRIRDLVPTGVVAVSSVSRVVFVCTANSARSQLAAALWSRASSVPATSAGTHPAAGVARGAVAAARRHRLTLNQSAPQGLTDVLRDDDYLITVCDNAHEELQHDGQLPGRDRSLHWSVSDPVPVGSDAAFDGALADLDRRVTNLAHHLTAS